MLFGDPKKFAIDISPEFREGDQFFGRFSAHAAGLEIGYSDAIVMLAIAESSLKRSLEYVGRRAIPTDTDDMQRLWYVLDLAYRGDLPDSEEQYVHVPAIHRFEVLTSFSESFDGVRCFLVEKDDSEILLWKEHDGDGTLNVARIPPGYYQQVVEEVLKGEWKNLRLQGGQRQGFLAIQVICTVHPKIKEIVKYLTAAYPQRPLTLDDVIKDCAERGFSATQVIIGLTTVFGIPYEAAKRFALSQPVWGFTLSDVERLQDALEEALEVVQNETQKWAK